MTKRHAHTDVIVIGGGAAGLMCALTAGRRGRRVTVLEHTNRIGKKILMSGGGRCNFTNLHCSPQDFVSDNPNFCVSALARYTQWDFIELVESHGIAYHEKKSGQLFCDGSSKDIVAMLAHECEQAAVDVLTNHEVTSVARDKHFEVISNGCLLTAESLVVATGGLSIPRIGATDFGYRLARQFGLTLSATRPGLVPLMFGPPLLERMSRIAGASVPASLTTLGNPPTAFQDDVLFTHRGLSGPATLQISSYWNPGEVLAMDLLPQLDAASFLMRAKSEQPRALVRSVLARSLPKALVAELQDLMWPEFGERRLAEIRDTELRDLGDKLNNWLLKPTATEGYRTAEVTLGGVSTAELSSRTMESRHHPGLYFVGEVVDVTGHLGGFNFQWAWSSGYAAGQVA